MSKSRVVVAIDGPAGAGKSTVSKLLAQELNYLLLDTGALYRCVGLAATRAGVEAEPAKVAEVAQQLAANSSIEFRRNEDGSQSVWLDGEDVSVAIRTPENSQAASRGSAIPEVRAALMDLQRSVGDKGGVVVEGRDIGTVVFPQAPAKFFLTASVNTRSARRHKELLARGDTTSLEEVAADVKERDRRDSTRPVAPLKQADDAVLVDSTEQTIDEVVQLMAEAVRRIEGE